VSTENSHEDIANLNMLARKTKFSIQAKVIKAADIKTLGAQEVNHFVLFVAWSLLIHSRQRRWYRRTKRVQMWYI
jgi:hypothetical protein